MVLDVEERWLPTLLLQGLSLDGHFRHVADPLLSFDLFATDLAAFSDVLLTFNSHDAGSFLDAR